MQYPEMSVKSSGEPRYRNVKNCESDESAIVPTFFPTESDLPAASTQVEIDASEKSTFATPLDPIGESESEESNDDTNNDHLDQLTAIEKLLSTKHGGNLPLAPLTGSSRAKLVASLAADFKDLSFEEHNQQATHNEPLSHAVARETSSESEQKSKLWSLNRKLNNVSATEPDYETAAELLNLDLDCPRFGKVTLKPWQVTGAAWMAMQEDSIIRGGIIGDQDGLGKKIQALHFICHRADTGCAPFYPTLIVARSPSIDIWYNEAIRFRDKFTILLFYGYAGTAGRKRKRYMVDFDQLNDRLKDMSSNDRQTGRTLIITSYTTFVRRTLKKVETEPSQTNRRGRRDGFANEN